MEDYYMRKQLTAVIPVFAILGIIGAVLRYIHTTTCYDSSGLPIEGAPVATVLFVLSIAAVAVSLVFSAAVSSKLTQNQSSAFSVGIFGLAVQVLSALLMAVSSFFGIAVNGLCLQSIGNIFGILCIAAVPAASVMLYKGTSGKASAYLLLLPAVFMCLRLVWVFYSNTSNPITPDYCFECVALGAAALYICSVSGFALGRPQTFTTVFSGLIAAAFSFISITGRTETLGDIMCYLSIPAFIIPGLFSFIKKLDFKNGK